MPSPTSAKRVQRGTVVKALEAPPLDMRAGELRGALERISADKGGWFAGRLALDDGNSVSIAGACPATPPLGSTLKLAGRFETHGLYGPQFKFTAIESTLPAQREGSIRFLETLPGVGAKRAAEIYDALGEGCVERVIADPSALAAVKGLGSDAARARIAESLSARGETIECERVLCAMQFGPRTQAKIVAEFGDQLAKILREDPYRLIAVDRVSFRAVDNAVMPLRRFPPDSPFRAAAAIREVLRVGAENHGHTWAHRDSLRERIADLKLDVPIPPDALPAGEARAVKAELVVRVDVGGALGVAIPSLDADETLCAERVADLLSRPVPAANYERALAAIPAETLAALTPEQRRGVENALRNRVSILTGGPGTGKTFTTKAILAGLRAACRSADDTRAKDPVAVVAPTGKAARRASEVTGARAETIHRLAYSLKSLAEEASPAAALGACPRAIVIDECSMVSIYVLALLLRAALRHDLRLVLVGDVDQLPPVGAGRVLGDLIDSGEVPVARLTAIQRQAAGSRIIAAAHAINRGLEPDLSPSPSGEFTFMAPRPSDPATLAKGDSPAGVEAARLAGMIVEVVRRAAAKFSLDPRRDIQVLAGQRSGAVGVIALNNALREAFNPRGSAPQISFGDGPNGPTIIRVGDKVVVTRNQYDLGVVNGDAGVVEAILEPSPNDRPGPGGKKPGRRVVVAVEGSPEPVVFEGDAIFTLSPAWAMTVHKSQGSEYPMVVMVMHHSMPWACQRALFYTGVTRARERLVLAGSRKAVGMAVRNVDPQRRDTRLAWLLRSRRAGKLDKAPAAATPAAKGGATS